MTPWGRYLRRVSTTKTDREPRAIVPTAHDRWGKDHWSLFGYVEAICVDGRKVEGLGRVGEIDRRRVRCNPARHPLLDAPNPFDSGSRWKDEYCTRLNEGTIADHDDWDCLDDLESAGLVEVMSLVNGYVVLTNEGIRVAAALRKHKAKGGRFANFAYPA